MTSQRVKEARKEADRSFERLYRGHRDDVFRAALRDLRNVHDAEDVTQAAFVDAYRAVLRGSSPEAPRAWLLAIAENVRRRRFRRVLRHPREEPLEEAAASEAADSSEEAQELRNALAALPSAQREVFVLREISGLSYEEIADLIGTSVASVQMSLFRARKTLRASLEPPTVARRLRALLPFPGWVPQFFGRADTALLTPRAFAAAGAAAVAIGGVAAQVDEPRAESGRAPAPLEQPATADAAPAGQAVLASFRPASRAPKLAAPTAPAARVAPVRTQRPATAATAAAGRSPAPASTAVPAASPPAAEVPAAASSPAGPAESPASPPTTQRPPARLPVATPAALPLPPLPLPEPPLPQLPLPELPVPQLPVPQLPAPQLEPVLAPVVEKVEDAAGAAGVVAPPLPPNPLDPSPPALPPVP